MTASSGSLAQSSEQLTACRPRIDCRDWRAGVVPDVPRDNVSSAAGAGSSHLQRVFKVRHRKLGGVADGFCASGCHGHEVGQFDDKVGGHPSRRVTAPRCNRNSTPCARRCRRFRRRVQCGPRVPQLGRRHSLCDCRAGFSGSSAQRAGLSEMYLRMRSRAASSRMMWS